MFRISIACSDLASAIRRVGFVTPAGIPAEPRAPDRRVREILLANPHWVISCPRLPALLWSAHPSGADIAGVDELVLADDALPSDQVFEQIEHLWCNGNDLCPAMKFAPVDVKCEFLEAIAQVANPHVVLPSQEGIFARPKNMPLVLKL